MWFLNNTIFKIFFHEQISKNLVNNIKNKHKTSHFFILLKYHKIMRKIKELNCPTLIILN